MQTPLEVDTPLAYLRVEKLERNWIGWGFATRFPKPFPDQNPRFSLSYLRPDQKLDSQFKA